MAWRRLGDKPLSEAVMVSLLTPQWVNARSLLRGIPRSITQSTVLFYEAETKYPTGRNTQCNPAIWYQWMNLFFIISIVLGCHGQTHIYRDVLCGGLQMDSLESTCVSRVCNMTITALYYWLPPTFKLRQTVVCMFCMFFRVLTLIELVRYWNGYFQISIDHANDFFRN